MTQLKMKVTSSASGFLVNHCDLQFDPFWQLFKCLIYHKGVNFFHQIMQEIGHNFVMNHQSPAKEVLLSFFDSRINIFQE
jgi:hypothetical protein